MILAAGATGVLGSEIVRRLAPRGGEVRAMARQTSAPEKVERLKAMGGEIVRADVKDPPTLVEASLRCRWRRRRARRAAFACSKKPTAESST